MLLLPLREFLVMVGSAKARSTNINCEVIPLVKHDKSLPVVDITYCEYRLTTRKHGGEDIEPGDFMKRFIVAGVLHLQFRLLASF